MADPHAPKIEDPFGLVGTTLDGQYRVDQVVGEGGYGVVYRGWHVSLEQPIAIKALKVLVDDSAVQDALFAKFKDEAKLLYTLSQASLNIVRSMDFGATTSPNGLWAPYMVLEWLAGRSLADDLSERRRRGLRGRTLDEALALLAPAAEGLTIAHQRRVAHRDIKPANFFILEGERGVAERGVAERGVAERGVAERGMAERGVAEGGAAGGPPRVKVLDFGIAKIIRDNEVPGTRSPFASFTWLYAAPEQLDPRIGQSGLATDVYSFALLLSELLSDRVPVEGRDVVTLLKAATDVTTRPTPRQRGVNVPDAIEVVCRRALAVDPKARYANIGELWAALLAARGASAPQVVISLTPSGGAAALPASMAHTAPQTAQPRPAQPGDPWHAPSSPGPPSPLLPTAPSPGLPQPSTGPGVFIPSGPLLGPQTGPPHTPPPGLPAGPPGYAPTRASAGYPPPFAPLPGSPPMLHHPSQLSPPPMSPPPGTQMVQRPLPGRMMPTSGSSLPVILAVIGLVLGLLFVATCGAIHAACN